MQNEEYSLFQAKPLKKNILHSAFYFLHYKTTKGGFYAFQRIITLVATIIALVATMPHSEP
jgi:uncharacterized membrane protein